jgi:hypothetical protein
MKLKHLLLGVSLTAFAIGFADIGVASQWGLARPLGAVFFILYLIVMLFEKEVALYDEEQLRNRAQYENAAAKSPATTVPNNATKPGGTNTLTTSHAH